MALIRYPGSKAKLCREIVRWLSPRIHGPLFVQRTPFEYREPFFGAGAIGFYVLGTLPPHCSVWLNDKDPAMHALWFAVAYAPVELQARVRDIKPTPALFYKLKEEDGRTDMPAAEIAVRKLALHRLSYSGLGFKSGGPLGGRNQSSKYNVDCRWNPETINGEIAKLHNVLKCFDDLKITNLDFTRLVQDAPEDCCIYLDPPYFEKGPQLYKFSMDQEDHNVLAIHLRNCRADWVLSYDDHAEIRRLYDWATITPVEFKYTMARATAATRPKNREIVIRRK